MCSGINSITDCTAQVKSARVCGLSKDGMFAVMDGGRSSEVPEKLSNMLEEILVEELREDEREREEGFTDLDPLQYLMYTFLTAHRSVSMKSLCYWL